jgi:hypothetical protein
MSLRPSEPGAKKAEMNPIKRYYEKGGRKRAIDAMCASCMGCTSVEQGNGQEDHLEQGFRNKIKHCTSPACSLFDFRPYQDKKEHQNRLAVIHLNKTTTESST